MNQPTDSYPVIPEERAEDLVHMDQAAQADLVLFMAGNQFMAMPELVQAFQRFHPEVGRIAYETLPPKLELQQILARGARFGSQILPGSPDVYSAVSRENIDILVRENRAKAQDAFVYLHNRLTLMVARDNPKQITDLSDLMRPDVRVSQPNPDFEDIAGHILSMYREAGGQNMVDRIMSEKVQAGTTLLTTVHHRQTPHRILAGEADVGPVWATEAANAKSQGLALDEVSLPPALDQRDKINYWICLLQGGRNPANGLLFLEFITTGAAQGILRRHGFIPHKEGTGNAEAKNKGEQ